MSDINPEEPKPVEEEPEVNQPEAEMAAAEQPEAEAQPEAVEVQPEAPAPGAAAPQAQLPPPPPRMLTQSEENTWAMIAHLSILVNLFTAFLGPVIALIIYLVFRDRSRYVAYQSMQAFLFQLIFWIGGGLLIGLMWTVVGVLAVVLIGLCLIPVALLVTLVPVVALGYGIVGGIQTAQGEDFRYWLVGDWTRELIEN
jgi:uncharacterized Tic20 family protein